MYKQRSIMLKKLVLMVGCMRCINMFGMESSFVVVDPDSSSEKIELSPKIIFSRYYNQGFSSIRLDLEQNAEVHFVEIDENLPTRVAFVAKKIFIVDKDDFDNKKKYKDKKLTIHNISSFLKSKDIKTDVIYQLDLYNRIIVVALSKRLVQGGNLIFSAPNIVFTDQQWWKWATASEHQTNNIFSEIIGTEKIKLEYQEKYTIEDLERAGNILLEDDFVFLDNSSPEYFSDIIKAIKENVSINTVNNAIDTLYKVVQSNIPQQNIEPLLNAIVANIQSLPPVTLSNININSIKNLWEKNADYTVSIINAVQKKQQYKSFGLPIDFAQRGYQWLNGLLVKQEPIKQDKEKNTIEIRYKNLENNNLTLVDIPKKNVSNTHNLFYANLIEFALKLSVVKAPRITLYTGAKKDTFNIITNTLKSDESKGQQIEMPKELNQSYLIDLSAIPNAHLVVMVQQNYLSSSGKHVLLADQITIVDQAVQKILSTDENKETLLANHFSPLKENTVGLIKFDLLKNQFNLLEKDSTFNDYPKKDVDITQHTNMPQSLIESYHQTNDNHPFTLSSEEDNVIPKNNQDVETVKTTEIDPGSNKSDFDTVSEEIQSTHLHDAETIESDKQHLLTEVNDLLKEDLFDENKKQFITKKCKKLIDLSEQLTMLANNLNKQYTTPQPIKDVFFRDIITSDISTNEKIVFIINTNDNFMVIAPKQVLQHLNNYQKAELALIFYSVQLSQDALKNQLSDIYANKQGWREVSDSSSITLPFTQENSENFEALKKLPEKPLNDDIQNVESNKQSLLKQVKDIVKTDLFDESTQQFNTEQCNKLIELSIGLSMLADNKPKKDRLTVANFFCDQLPYNILRDDKNIVFLMTQDNFMFIVPSKVFELLHESSLVSSLPTDIGSLKDEFIQEQGDGASFRVESCTVAFYVVTLPQDELKKRLTDIYANKQGSNDEPDQKLSETLGPKRVTPEIVVPPPLLKNEENSFKTKPTWSWYKPWTWSWGGYYFKKESYERDKPEKAAQYYKDYGYEQEDR